MKSKSIILTMHRAFVCLYRRWDLTSLDREMMTADIFRTTTNNRRIVLTALANPDDNVVCPVKLLLIQALRLNHTSSTTVQQILATASCRQDRKIVWKSTSMDLPVIPAIAQGGSRLRTEHPAQPSQISESVKAAANTLGILVPVTSHDVRRGSARDVAFLEKVPGTSTRSAAAALGHSDAARRSGVTSKYIGPVKEDLWSKRLEASKSFYHFKSSFRWLT